MSDLYDDDPPVIRDADIEQAEWEAASAECAYCHMEVTGPPDADPPAYDDDEAWATLADEHDTGCEWIQTRGGQWHDGSNTRYEVREDSGARTVIEAANWADAIAQGEEWVSEGSYAEAEDGLTDESFYTPVYVVALCGPDMGQQRQGEALIDLEPDAPPCPKDDDGDDHDWRESGPYGGQGTQLHYHDVCRRCGLTRLHSTESTPGNYPHVPPRTSYQWPSERGE